MVTSANGVVSGVNRGCNRSSHSCSCFILCFCLQSVVNRPRVLQLGELTRDGFGGGEWAEREVAHPHG